MGGYGGEDKGSLERGFTMNGESQDFPLDPIKQGGSKGVKQGGLTPGQVKRLPKWQISLRPLILRVWSGSASPRSAIKGFCLDCMGEDRQAVADCGDRCCPLWRYRPFQKNRKEVI